MARYTVRPVLRSHSYYVIQSPNKQEFETAVIEAQDAGWKLEGGVTVTQSGSVFNYFQSVSRVDEVQ